MNLSIKKISVFVLILFWLFLLIYFYLSAILFYYHSLVIIFVAGCIILLISKFWAKEKHSELFFALVGIFLTVLLFVLQNFQSVTDIKQGLSAANKYNCEAAERLYRNISQTTENNHISMLAAVRFSTDFYKNQMPFLNRINNGTGGLAFYKMIQEMDMSNRLLDLNQFYSSESVVTFIEPNEEDKRLQTANSYTHLIQNLHDRIKDSASGTIKKILQIDDSLNEECN